MVAPDLLHEFELGVWKRTFTHLLRILMAHSSDRTQILNERYILIQPTLMYSPITVYYRYRSVPTFGNGIIQKFRTNPSSMKKLAGRDFEDLLQVHFFFWEILSYS